MRSPKDFFRPLAVGAPEPVREIPFPPSRVIHFFPGSNPKMVAKVPDIAPTVDILLCNLEDAVAAADKEAARAGLVEVGRAARQAAIDAGTIAAWEVARLVTRPWAWMAARTLVLSIPTTDAERDERAAANARLEQQLADAARRAGNWQPDGAC